MDTESYIIRKEKKRARMIEEKIAIKIVSKSGRIPTYATAGSAGADLCACLEEPCSRESAG